jgi:uncharacterized membrane-anchored protein
VLKEQTLRSGTLVLLELAPVDPRSLMQGDYMSLNYAIAFRNNDSIPQNGYFVLQLDEHSVGTRIRVQENDTPLNTGEIIIKYKNHGRNIGAESFFFEEGKAEKYEDAHFGGLMVDKHGNSILTGLFNNDFLKIE